jgi:hypothetical protein
MTLQLTKLLYPIDEVLMSFKQCILKKKPLRETLYWLWELYYSGEDIDKIISDIYFELYASLNPPLYSYVKLKRKKYLKINDIKEIASIVCNLRINVPCLDSYLINYYVDNLDKCFPLKIYKKKINICDRLKYKKELIPLLMSIYYQNVKNIAYYLVINLKKYDIKIIYDEIVYYYKSEKNVERSLDKNFEYIEKLWSDCQSVKSLISIIVYLFIPNSKINNSLKFIAPNTTIVDELNEHYNSKPSKMHYLLREKRLYSTHYELGPAIYGRINKLELKNACCYYWEYYCKNTPSWKKRFEKYNVKFNGKNIQFDNDDLLEEFYDKYGLEFDEQSMETQELSIHDVYIENNPFLWFNNLK